MEKRKDPTSAARLSPDQPQQAQQQHGQQQHSPTTAHAKPGQQQASQPLGRQQSLQAERPKQQQQGAAYEPKLVRDPKTGDYYDQNQAPSAMNPSAPRAAPAQRQQQQSAGQQARRQSK
jgi:hypothetical protein